MRFVVIFVVASFLVTPFAFSATDNFIEGMGQKALRGAVNLVTGIVEVPAQTYKGYHNGFESIESRMWSRTAGTILGFFRGISHAAGRISWGAIELFGFWSANHPDNENVGIPFDAEYAWEEGQQYSVFDPSFSEGIKPVGSKLVRGLIDGVTGIVELPAQSINGAFAGSLAKGIGRGIWFWFSRELYGIGSVFTCIVPNPPDNPGYPFDGQYPWTALQEDLDE